jgi:4-aminobutyrate aminotransferase
MSDQPQQSLAPVWAHLTDLVIERAEGAYVYTSDGRRFLDFTSGIGVTNTGHCHPRVVKAAQEQAAKVIHAQINIYYHRPVLELVEALLDVVPPPLDSFFFSNSGAEAVEASVKLARHATGRPSVIVFHGGFHGRTVGTMSLTTSKTIYRLRYQPLMPGVTVAPFPYAYRYGWDPETTSQWCLKELRHLLHTQSDPSETAAMLVEPVLGEGGYVVPPPSFLAGLREIADEHDILLIIDEVQSGFGRTGRFFAFEHADIVPDILVMAKGLGSGFPISSIAARRELMDRWAEGTHGGTYGGGNAVSSAAAAASVRVLLEEGLVDNAARQGDRLMAGLRALQAKHPVMGDVRGLGLMVAVEFTTPGGDPDPTSAKAVQARCLEEDLILLTCGPYGNVIRWVPPLVVTADQIDAGLAIFGQALDSVL